MNITIGGGLAFELLSHLLAVEVPNADGGVLGAADDPLALGVRHAEGRKDAVLRVLVACPAHTPNTPQHDLPKHWGITQILFRKAITTYFVRRPPAVARRVVDYSSGFFLLHREAN